MINKNSILRNECFSSRKKNYKIKYFKQITFFSQLNWGLDKDSCKMQWKCVYLLVHYLLEGIKTESVISNGRYMNYHSEALDSKFKYYIEQNMNFF
jgi:hypothetical protein